MEQTWHQWLSVTTTIKDSAWLLATVSGFIKLSSACFMGTSSLKEYGCASPIIKHLHFQNEIPGILLHQSTSFPGDGGGKPGCPSWVGTCFRTQFHWCLSEGTTSERWPRAQGIREGCRGAGGHKLLKAPVNEDSRDPLKLRWAKWELKVLLRASNLEKGNCDSDGPHSTDSHHLSIRMALPECLV